MTEPQPPSSAPHARTTPKRITARDNFAYLTVALLALLLAITSAHQFFGGAAGWLIEAATILALAAGVWSIRRQTYSFRTGLGLIVVCFGGALGGRLLDIVGMETLHLIGLLAFFGLTTWVAAKQVLFSGRVNGNAIIGTVCIYLLLGMIWAMLYVIAEAFAPGSFKGLSATSWPDNFPDLVYFSFVSLSTMGFGDITPALPLPRFLSYLEGIFGQFYLAIVVASLVGARVSDWSEKR